MRTLVAVALAVLACSLPRAARAEGEARPSAREMARRRVPPRRVTLTADPTTLAFFAPSLVVTSEVRAARRWSLALTVGYGLRPLDTTTFATTRAWQLGIEPRAYFVGGFDQGFYVGWSTTFARGIEGPIGFESLHAPPGLATGGVIGVKSTWVPIITPDAAIGFAVPLATPSTEASPPPIALVARFGIGVSF